MLPTPGRFTPAISIATNCTLSLTAARSACTLVEPQMSRATIAPVRIDGAVSGSAGLAASVQPRLRCRACTLNGVTPDRVAILQHHSTGDFTVTIACHGLEETFEVALGAVRSMMSERGRCHNVDSALIELIESGSTILRRPTLPQPSYYPETVGRLSAVPRAEAPSRESTSQAFLQTLLGVRRQEVCAEIARLLECATCGPLTGVGLRGASPASITAALWVDTTCPSLGSRTHAIPNGWADTVATMQPAVAVGDIARALAVWVVEIRVADQSARGLHRHQRVRRRSTSGSILLGTPAEQRSRERRPPPLAVPTAVLRLPVNLGPEARRVIASGLDCEACDRSLATVRAVMHVTFDDDARTCTVELQCHGAQEVIILPERVRTLRSYTESETYRQIRQEVQERSDILSPRVSRRGVARRPAQAAREAPAPAAFQDELTRFAARIRRSWPTEPLNVEKDKP